MPSAKELQAELRALRKDHVKPVSRMRMGDIAAEIQALRGVREETPAVAAVPSAPVSKSKAAAKTIKEAKKQEFPTEPTSGAKAAAAKVVATKAPAAAVEKKKSRLARLLEMMGDEEA